MQPETSRTLSKSKTVLLGSMVAILVILIICFPEQAFQSSLQGLQIWWKLVFPALLPFLILTEIMIGFGIVQAIGTLMDPLMRKILRLPGAGGWALASGMLVGFPTGAKITSALREQDLLSHEEAERLTGLSHLCSPFFLVTIIGVGFLNSAQLGISVAVIHYLAAFIAAILMRKKELSYRVDTPSAGAARSILAECMETMHEARLRDGRTFGKLLGDAVTSSVQALMLIGGYMMIFSVTINVVNLSGLIEEFRYPLDGLFEIHLGAYAAAAQYKETPLMWQLAILGAALGWGGLSAHAQVRGLTQHTAMRYLPFLYARILHGSLAFALTVLLWKPLQWLFFSGNKPSFLTLSETSGGKSSDFSSEWMQSGWSSVLPVFIQFFLLLAVMLVLSLFLKWKERSGSNR